MVYRLQSGAKLYLVTEIPRPSVSTAPICSSDPYPVTEARCTTLGRVQMLPGSLAKEGFDGVVVLGVDIQYIDILRSTRIAQFLSFCEGTLEKDVVDMSAFVHLRCAFSIQHHAWCLAEIELSDGAFGVNRSRWTTTARSGTISFVICYSVLVQALRPPCTTETPVEWREICAL